MKIAHVAPFAPGRCGLYESVRDLMAGERRLGHEAVLVDSGVVGEGAHYDQADGDVVAGRPEAARGCDVLVTHTAPSPAVREAAGDVPVVHVIHGRPESSFRLNQRKPGVSPVYDLYAKWAREKTVAQFVTLWPEHLPYWRAILGDLVVSTGAPPCDLTRWSSHGPKHVWRTPGEKHVLVADPWGRDDVEDPYHVAHGLLLAAQRRPGIRVHFYGISGALGPWEHLFRAFRQANALGETCGMMRDIASRYRAADVVVTPHRIATRIVREAAACGATVVTGEPRAFRVRWGSYGSDPLDPESVCDAVLLAIDHPSAPEVARYDCRLIAAELLEHWQFEKVAT